MELNCILKYAIESGASDIHITENHEGWVRAKGNLNKWGNRIALSDIDEFIELVDEIDKWQKENEKAVQSPYQSESFGGYTYTLKENVPSWKTAFASRLNQWRKI